ncbi:hypothetical protein [Salinispira pacifica]
MAFWLSAGTLAAQGFFSAADFPATGGYPSAWQASFTRALEADGSLYRASPTALTIVGKSVTTEQLAGDPQAAAAFCLSLVEQVDFALRGGESPTRLSAEVAHALRLPDNSASGPRGRIDRAGSGGGFGAPRGGNEGRPGANGSGPDRDSWAAGFGRSSPRGSY